MAALALIFAIQDYDPSPFYYFDEVDQNLDGYNAERIALMCRERSKRAQFIMVTLRKVSLRLADHHIGITHGGDGCSRRIVDFDREQAIAIGELAMAEAEKADQKVRSRIEESFAAAHDMPEVPEPLPTPSSLGGLLDHIPASGEEVSEEPEPSHGLTALSERTADMTEDIEEYAEVAQAIQEVETQEAEESTNIELDTDVEEETV